MQALKGLQFRTLLAIMLLVMTVSVVGLLALREFLSKPAPLHILLPSPTASPSTVIVHLAGQVMQPGVYTFPPGTRLHEAISAAGGPSLEADLDALNQALVLQDGQRYFVPRRGESVSSLLDVNTASLTQLEALDGIGPEIARRILTYRQQNGPFTRLEDLLNVQGIGPSLLERLRSQATVG